MVVWEGKRKQGWNTLLVYNLPPLNSLLYPLWKLLIHIHTTAPVPYPCLNSRPIILSLQAASLEVVLTFILFCSFVVRTSRSLCHLYRAGQHATDQYKYRNIHASALHPKPQRNFCWGVKFSLEVYQTAKTKNLNKTWEE